MNQLSDESPVDLSIILVSYNSRADLLRCLPSIFSQDYAGTVEVVVVDNHGDDGVTAELTRSFPQVRVLPNPTNNGYAGGNNLGFASARGRWILFLNPDTVLHAGCLAQLMRSAHAHPTALITPKLLNPDGTINACGNQMQYTGVTTCRSLNQPADSETGLQRIPLLSGAALLAPAAVLRRIGAFVDTYFMYFEDTELSIRAKLSGVDLLCDADAVITHYYKTGISPTKFYYLERNRLLTLLTLFERQTLRKLLPGMLLTELLMWGFALRGWAYLRTRSQTYAYLYGHRAQLRERRQTVQALRQLPDSVIIRESLTSLPFDQLVRGHLGKWLDNLLKPIYRALRPQLFLSDSER